MGFPVVIDKKKDGSVKIFVDYRALNMERLKAKKFPLSKIEKVIADLAGSKFSASLTCLPATGTLRYWKTYNKRLHFVARSDLFSLE